MIIHNDNGDICPIAVCIKSSEDSNNTASNQFSSIQPDVSIKIEVEEVVQAVRQFTDMSNNTEKECLLEKPYLKKLMTLFVMITSWRFNKDELDQCIIQSPQHTVNQAY